VAHRARPDRRRSSRPGPRARGARVDRRELGRGVGDRRPVGLVRALAKRRLLGAGRRERLALRVSRRYLLRARGVGARSEGVRRRFDRGEVVVAKAPLELEDARGQLLRILTGLRERQAAGADQLGIAVERCPRLALVVRPTRLSSASRSVTRMSVTPGRDAPGRRRLLGMRWSSPGHPDDHLGAVVDPHGGGGARFDGARSACGPSRRHRP
jgi:hypothetical protein